MFKLYGKKTRCLWCGKSDKQTYKEMLMTIKQAKPPQEKAIVCSEECEKAVLITCKFIEKSITLFWIGTILGTILGVSGILAPIMGKKILPVSTMGVLLLGITFIIFPFVTPQTIRIFGLRMGMILGRISGMILLLLGLILIFKI